MQRYYYSQKHTIPISEHFFYHELGIAAKHDNHLCLDSY